MNPVERGGSMQGEDPHGTAEIEAVVVESGRRKSHIGIQVCRGPGTLRILLTRPYRSAGRTVEVPLDDVESIRPAGES
jgi:hypothetical protein